MKVLPFSALFTSKLLTLLTLSFTKYSAAFPSSFAYCVFRSLLDITVLLKGQLCEKLLKSIRDLITPESCVFSSTAPIKVCDSWAFFTCAERTCEIGGIHKVKKASVSLGVLYSELPEFLRQPEHHHMGISWESS